MWLVEYSDEFGEWWSSLDEEDQEDVSAVVGELEKQGPTLPYPFSSDVRGSKHGHMRNSGFRVRANRLESFTPLIPGERLFY
jgi:hypothetical protein